MMRSLSARRISKATLDRLPSYLRVLNEFLSDSRATVSSEHLAELAGHSQDTVRRDLWCLDAQGTRGVGYGVADLHGLIGSTLGSQRPGRIAIAGAGKIGVALAQYPSLRGAGFEVVAVFDADAARIGQSVGEIRIRPVDELVQVCRGEEVNIGVIATPAEAAAETARAFARAGVKALLNFAPLHLEVPETVALRQVDLLADLQVLHHRAL